MENGGQLKGQKNNQLDKEEAEVETSSAAKVDGR